MKKTRQILNRKLKIANMSFSGAFVLCFVGIAIAATDDPGEASRIGMLGFWISMVGMAGICFAHYGLRRRVRCPSCRGLFDMKSLGQFLIFPAATLRTAMICPFCSSDSHDGAKCADCGRRPAEMMNRLFSISPEAVCCPYCGLSLDEKPESPSKDSGEE